MNQTSADIERNIESRKQTDRIMWFSMWFLLSIASFGMASFPMIYYLIRRRNAHFSRQENLEPLILQCLKQLDKKIQTNYETTSASSKQKNVNKIVNPQTWTISAILIFPAFYILYSLKSDLQKHEEHEHQFLAETVSMTKDLGLSLNLPSFVVTKKFASDKYLIFSIATLGFAAVYWLYRIFNDYNMHFKTQWKTEDEILRLFKSINSSNTT